MLDKTYNPAEIEKKHYERAEQAGTFAAHPGSIKKPYTIMMPPPNVTGNLHMGHALTFSVQDILIRYYRRANRDALWMPGTDHAGIATQMVVERQLAEQKVTRHDLGREKFLEKVWHWKEESGGAITRQLRRLGASADWNRERFTLDDGLSHAVRKVFVELHKQKLIYRDKRLVNWDPKLQTAISDLEVEQRPTKGKLWYLHYPLVGEDGYITIATTRPESMLGGDAAVAVHPEDDRYKKLIGKKVKLPMVDYVLPIIADEYVDREKGSGAVKISPAHDFNDFEIAKRHNLPMPNVFDKTAHLNELAPTEYRGMDRFKAREKFVAEMESLGLLEKIEDNAMVIPHGDRSGVVIEPYLTDQWYCDAVTLAKPAIDAVRTGKIKFVPQKWENTYYSWMENIQPWCISRQLWWGHQIPAWYGPDGQVFVGMDDADVIKQAEKHYNNTEVYVQNDPNKPVETRTANTDKIIVLVRDQDVLDTWFSSALWPFSTLGWENGNDKRADWNELKRYYPTDVLVTGFDIIFFWVARMVMMGMHFIKDVPFREIYIHALVRDAKGQKMSKTKGNVIDPLSTIDEFGCDALRFTLAALSVPGRDIKMSTDRINGYRSFATKLWNAARFCEMNGCAFDANFDPATATNVINKWIIGEIVQLEKKLSAAIADYRFDEAANMLYHTTWGSFCDWYLEFTKPILASEDIIAASEVRKTTAWALSQLTHMLNPFMPFITEELSEKLSFNHDRPLITEPWPKYDAIKVDANAADEVNWLIDVISTVRTLRMELNISPSAPLSLLFKDISPAKKAQADQYRDVIMRLARLKDINHVVGDLPKGAVVGIVRDATIVLPVADVIDLGVERARLEKEMKKLADELAKLDAKLNNPKFMENAAEDAVEEVREKRAEAAEIQEKLQSALKRIAG